MPGIRLVSSLSVVAAVIAVAGCGGSHSTSTAHATTTAAPLPPDGSHHNGSHHTGRYEPEDTDDACDRRITSQRPCAPTEPASGLRRDPSAADRS